MFMALGTTLRRVGADGVTLPVKPFRNEPTFTFAVGF